VWPFSEMCYTNLLGRDIILYVRHSESPSLSICFTLLSTSLRGVRKVESRLYASRVHVSLTFTSWTLFLPPNFVAPSS
jgi:hypothetical protein